MNGEKNILQQCLQLTTFYKRKWKANYIFWFVFAKDDGRNIYTDLYVKFQELWQQSTIQQAKLKKVNKLDTQQIRAIQKILFPLKVY